MLTLMIACGWLVACGEAIPPPGAASSTPSVDSTEAAAACDTHGQANLLAAFASTAGVVAAWQDNTELQVAQANSASVTRLSISPWHDRAANTGVYVCYWEGSFAAGGPPNCPNFTPPTRAIVVVDPADHLIREWLFGFDNDLPIQRPSSNGDALIYRAPIAGDAKPPCK